MRKIIPILITLLGFSTAEAQAQTPGLSSGAGLITACASSLKLNEVAYQSNEIVQFALFTFMLSKSSTDAEMKAKFSGLIAAGFFDGSLSDANKRRDELERRLNLSIDYQQSVGILSKSLSPEASGAFSSCVKDVFAKPGLELTVIASDVRSTTIQAHYKSQENETRHIRFVVLSDGLVSKDTNLDIASSGGEAVIVFKRANYSLDLHVQVNVMIYDSERKVEVLGASAGLSFPPQYGLIHSVTRTAILRSEISHATCGSYESREHRAGTTVELRPSDADGVLDTNNVSFIMTRLEGENNTGVGAGSVFQLVSSSPDLVQAHVICDPGSNTSKSHFVEGYISAPMIVTKLTVVSPKDNGIDPENKIVARGTPPT